MNAPLLAVEQLTLTFRTRSGLVNALDRVSLEARRGEIVGVVGESGSGKSVTAYAIMGLLDRAARVVSGTVHVAGLDMLNARERDRRDLRGREASMIFQSPRSALNPIRSVGKQIEDVLRRHKAIARRDLRRAAVQALAEVNIPDPERRYHAYPFELSGGLCQRVGIAAALACKPSLLIADEPTTGLDVTTQAAVMDLLREQSRERRMTTVLITHDLHLAAEVCDRIVVMHAGQVIETGNTRALFEHACHPYTVQLIAATPSARGTLDDISAIPGGLPDLRANNLPPCRFAARCERRLPVCDQPGLALGAVTDPDHKVSCRNPLALSS